MRGKTVQIDWRDDEAVLKRAYLAESDMRVKPRLHFLWLVRQGKQAQEASALVGVNERTGRQWLAWYRAGGTALVRSRFSRGTGQPALLTIEQQQAFRSYADTTGFATANDACAWISEQFGVRYSQAGMYGLLRRLRIKKKVPRPINAKADEQVQEAYKKGA